MAYEDVDHREFQCVTKEGCHEIIFSLVYRIKGLLEGLFEVIEDEDRCHHRQKLATFGCPKKDQHDFLRENHDDNEIYCPNEKG